VRRVYIHFILAACCIFASFDTVAQTSPVEALPSGVRPGINYHEDDTKVTLVLQAPGKDFAFVAGDFNSWSPDDTFLMNQTPDGEYFWFTLENLQAQKEYVFQYWVDDEIKIGDPYADKVADPWNDGLIRNETYPNLPSYPFTDYGIATVLQTGQQEYQWSAEEQNWIRPDIDHLVIYELLVRDFMKEHTFKALIDTLDYIKNLGVDAIEVMPFNEFEGNESWGYNPSYYFAPDKYYGTKDELKEFIEAAHQKGLAIIMDMVLNHAYGQNAMVQLYFNNEAGKPAADNPWFNVDHVGPFEWGYDFDHESEYTRQFMDSVNRYWIEEYHVDGFRFDFTKGFTNNGPNIDGFDQDRIDILKRMADQIWETDPKSYVILEHWGPPEEENNLADYGMKLWSNRSYDYVPAIVGNSGGSFQSMNRQSHVSFYNSHDERRIAEHALTEGLNRDGYDIKSPLVMYERMKLAAAFTYLYPGPKMIWQFDELGYDIDINFNGRTGNKPLPWGEGGLGYYEDSLRQHIYTAFAEILDLRKQITPEALDNATKNHKETGGVRRLSFDTDNIDLVLVGNFGLSESSVDPSFSQTGTWYSYFDGIEIQVNSTSAPIALQPGEWHIYTSAKLSEGNPGVNLPYSNPVVVTPSRFDVATEITITFDATKSSPGKTSGLVGAEKVYFHSGLVLQHPDSTLLEKEVGNGTDDGVGLMTKTGEDLWSITITPEEYFSLSATDEPYKLGMYFRDANSDNLGLGFRNTIIYYNFESDAPFVQIEPPSFKIDDRITVTFNSRRGK